MIHKIITLGLTLLCVTSLSSCSKDTYSTEEKAAIIKQAQELVDKKAPWREVLPLYKKLTEFEKPNSEPRTKTLRYLLDTSLKFVEEGNAAEALASGEALNEVIPNDFYIQNRILGAYRLMAEQAMAKKDWKTAEDILYNKALRIRFDFEVMRTYLKLKMEMGKEAIAGGKFSDARVHLDEVVVIANIPENQGFYSKEKQDAEKLLQSIAGK